MYPKQRAAIYEPRRISVIAAGTKVGKTVSALAWLLEQALNGKENRNYWWVAPVFGQAEIGFRRMKAKLPKEIYRANQSTLTISLINGTKIWFKSGERFDDLYGEDVWACVMDEASRMREEAWHAIRSTLTATRGPVRIIGNVKGKKNWFYQLGELAQRGDQTDMAFHRMTVYDAVEAGVLDKEEIESSRRDFERLGRLGAWKQLYLAEASEDGDNPFGLEAIRLCTVDENGNPLGFSNTRPLVAGVDLAGRGAQNQNPASETADRDFTAVAMFDKDGYMTYFNQFRGSHTYTEEQLVATIGRTSALIDSTGQGDATVERLQKRGDMRVEGFRFTEVSRQDLLEGLALAIGQRRIKFPDVPGENGAPSLVEQLEAFEFDYSKAHMRYSVPKGMHEDGAMALALAVKKLPWKRSYHDVPTGIEQPGGSKWTGEMGDEAWKAYQSTLKPSQKTYTTPKEPRVAVPMVVRGGGRWGGADR